MRVPVENGSLTDLTVKITTAGVTPSQVIHAFADAARGRLKSILRYTERGAVADRQTGHGAERPLVSASSFYRVAAAGIGCSERVMRGKRIDAGRVPSLLMSTNTVGIDLGEARWHRSC